MNLEIIADCVGRILCIRYYVLDNFFIQLSLRRGEKIKRSLASVHSGQQSRYLVSSDVGEAYRQMPSVIVLLCGNE